MKRIRSKSIVILRIRNLKHFQALFLSIYLLGKARYSDLTGSKIFDTILSIILYIIQIIFEDLGYISEYRYIGTYDI